MEELKTIIQGLINKLTIIKEERGLQDGEVFLKKQDNGVILVMAKEEVVHYLFDERELNEWALQ